MESKIKLQQNTTITNTATEATQNKHLTYKQLVIEHCLQHSTTSTTTTTTTATTTATTTISATATTTSTTTRVNSVHQNYKDSGDHKS